MSNLFDDIWDALSGGQVTRAREEKGKLFSLRSRLETTVKNYNYWYTQGTILSKSLYQITIMAFNEVRKLHDIFEHISVNQRNIIEHALQKKDYVLKDIEKSVSALNAISNSARGMLDTQKFAKDTLDNNLSILKEMPNSAGLASAGVYTLISGLEHYSSLNSQISQLKAGQYSVLKKIDKLEIKLFKLKAEVHRADELGVGIGKGLSVFRHSFDDFYRKFFPNGDDSKREREARLASGGTYFLDSEQLELRLLVNAGGYLLKMIEAKF